MADRTWRSAGTVEGRWAAVRGGLSTRDPTGAKASSSHLDFKKATVVKSVDVDFPAWMVDLLDKEAVKLNVSRQAVIKMWILDSLDPSHRATR
ncbi:MAG: hypothetical protein ABII00_08785 [Elusimicrobiota bacterium]